MALNIYIAYIVAMKTSLTLYTLSAYIQYIVNFANIVSFTKQLQNRGHTRKKRQADSKLPAASLRTLELMGAK